LKENVQLGYLNERKTLSSTITENPNKGKHGIGATLEKKFSKTTITNSDGSKTTSIIQTTTIKIRNNIFGAEFAALYGTKEARGIGWASLGLSAVSLYYAETIPVTVAWLYIGQTKVLPKVFLGVQAIALFKTKFRCGYEAGGKIEDKFVIKSTRYKDGHIVERIKGTYTVWGHTGMVGTSQCYENKENFF
jgi:hypothetical protein